MMYTGMETYEGRLAAQQRLARDGMKKELIAMSEVSGPDIAVAAMACASVCSPQTYHKYLDFGKYADLRGTD